MPEIALLDRPLLRVGSSLTDGEIDTDIDTIIEIKTDHYNFSSMVVKITI